MALTDESNGTSMVMPVAPMYGGGYGNNNGWGGDWAWILLLLLIGGNGWGMGGFGGAGAMMGMGMADGFGLYPWLNNSQNINNGFRDQMLSTQVSSIGDKITSGFGDVQTSLCGGFAGVNATVNGVGNSLSQQLNANQLSSLERSFAAQTANTAGMTALQSQLAQCCCDNRAATADLKYTVATEACADRAAISDGIRDVIESNNRTSQAILDKLCQLELDGVKGQLAQAQRENLGLQNQVNMATMQASQVQQTSDIINGTYTRLSQCPVNSTPVYGNTPIFTCPQNAYNNGCGCGGNSGFVN